MSTTTQNRRLIVRRKDAARPAHVSATVFQVNREDSTSRQIEAIDSFSGFVVAGNGSLLLPTPYKVPLLFQVCERSNMLPQCIESYVTNIVRTGWEVDSVIRGKPAPQSEIHELQSFIDHANVDQSLVDVLESAIRERESVGFGFIEVIRDASGLPAILRHAPSLYTRLCSKHDTPVLVTNEIQRGRRVTVVKEWKKFRRFVQLVNGHVRYFKEFGDPRRMNANTGIFLGEQGYTEGFDASEIIHLRLPSTEPYGVPRWINQLPSIMGSREAEEVNMRYFQDNTVPPMVLLVGNGRLTRQSYEQLNRTLNSEGVGRDRQNRILLLEAMGQSDNMDGVNSSIDLKIEKLTDTRQSDGLFKDYDEGNMAKVRSSFRLPPVLVGMSQDVNFATATTSVFVAESQVFAPERSVLDGLLNRLLVNGPRGLGMKNAKLTSRVPAITSPDMVVKTLTALNVMGAVTPRSAQATANTMLQAELPAYPREGEEGYEEWMDRPLAITNANIRKSQADQAMKTDHMKETEGTGETSHPPKHGEE